MTRVGMVLAVVCVLAGLAVYATVGAQQTEERNSESEVRVGTFDSRAVAHAYYRSDEVFRDLARLRAEYEEAKETGDDERVAELEAVLAARSELAAKQGFSTWPVDNILAEIEEEIPGIAAQAGVDLIVSRWHVVYQGEAVELINVTELMAMPFDPDEETLQMVRDIQQLDPASLEEVEKHLGKH